MITNWKENERASTFARRGADQRGCNRSGGERATTAIAALGLQGGVSRDSSPASATSDTSCSTGCPVRYAKLTPRSSTRPDPAAAVCSPDGGESDSRLRASGATSAVTTANESAVRAVPACSRMMTRFASSGVTIRLDEVFGSHSLGRGSKVLCNAAVKIINQIAGIRQHQVHFCSGVPSRNKVSISASRQNGPRMCVVPIARLEPVQKRLRTFLARFHDYWQVRVQAATT